MKAFILMLFVVPCLSTGYCQDWIPINMPTLGRLDDIYFVNEQTGWVAGAQRGRILKTIDGGSSWTFQLTSDRYLRSIEFATANLGFCGSLDSSLYKTTDGGKNWVEIASTIIPKPPGICGLSAPDSIHIYGCGIWRSPAFVIKSTDGGNTWSFIDMSSYASKLVDIYFLSKDTGFVTGTANPVTEGGIVLRTTNGGITWQVMHKTGVNEDIIWKIQSPDNTYFFGSINARPFTNDTRIIKSIDRGLTWNTIQVKTLYNNVEMIGFIDSLTGWTGGVNSLFKTTDGGSSWSGNLVTGDVYLNRFFRVNHRSAYLSGNIVYKYQSTVTSLPSYNVPARIDHSIQITPNPGRPNTKVKINFANSTFANVSLYTSEGKKLAILLNGRVTRGIKTFELNLSHYSASSYFLILETNEGLQHTKILKW